MRSSMCCTPTIQARSEAAKNLGLKTYLSTAVRQLHGTLCAASANTHPMPSQAQAVLQLFTALICKYVERDMLLKELQRRNQELAAHAMTDALTGLPNRRAWMKNCHVSGLAQNANNNTS